MTYAELLLLHLDQLDEKIKDAQRRADIAILRKLYYTYKKTRQELIDLTTPAIQDQFPHHTIEPQIK